MIKQNPTYLYPRSYAIVNRTQVLSFSWVISRDNYFWDCVVSVEEVNILKEEE